jgi:formylglycine-generating enzyme required for sulfatase activity
MSRVFPSWFVILVALVLGFHLACSTTTTSKPSTAPPGMVLIPGGSFMMGCTDWDAQCMADEHPRHRVRVKAFYLDITEVTVETYRKCVGVGGCTAPDTDVSPEKYCNWGREDRYNHPINCVLWEQANVYCQWVGKRLPSEAEWEYAARAGHSGWRYPWGNEWPDCSQAILNRGCGRNRTWPVGSKGANGFGLYDMAGNVWEWVADCYHEHYNKAPKDGQPWTDEGCTFGLRKGGSWQDNIWELRVSYRFGANPQDGFAGDGFRCAKSIE